MSFAIQHAHAQSYNEISGTINSYISIRTIRSAEDYNPDSVVVAPTNLFEVNDTVMVYCVKGSIIGTGPGSYPPGDDFYGPGVDAQDPRNTGKYAFVLISEVIGDTIVFNTSINPEILPLEDGEMAQLIKVRSYRYANVGSSGLSAPSWDPATGTGGVIALFVHGILRLDGDIDVSGDGFRGARGNTDVLYGGDCSSLDTMSYYEHFYLDGELFAGLKGEGTTDTTFYYNRGKGSSINGGGGGNGLLAGGGGGSNYARGVRGGEESTECTGTGVSVTGGAGGFDLGRSGYYYVNLNPFNRGNRIFFGGGGGSGTRVSGGTTTNGGNGGGIVVIVADTIMGNGGGIYADGGDVTGTAVNGAGAGGGGAGCIILEVAGYRGGINSIELSAIGGNGGNSSGTDTTGVGGAGGGGIYWHTGIVKPPQLNAIFGTGTNGVFLSVPPYNPPMESPTLPYLKNRLVAPLRGFLFNPVPSEFRICSDQDPVPIVASVPKGGDGTYTYQWIDSSSTQNFWADIVGATGKDYDPGPLTDTTYYRRIVSSNSGTIVDTSFRIVVYVHPAITDNVIAANDTVCFDNAPELFVPDATIGGGPTGGTFNYIWQARAEGAGSYTDLTAKTTEPTYQSIGLTTSTQFRRIAYAGVCIDTSNVERVQVFASLTGNDITPYDTICINTAPDLISGPAPGNGDQDDLRYQWLSSTDPGLMGTLIPGQTGLSYQSPALTQTTYIRRVVLSGNDDACRDTSAYVEILNVPDITNNFITASQTVCQQSRPDLLNGTNPGGGVPGQYSYTWISSTDQSSWAPATGGGPNNLSNYDPGVMTGDTTWYRRVVGSGGLELVCKDTSTFIVVNVLPSITNNVITPADDLKCQWDWPDGIGGTVPGGGATVEGSDVTREYRWEVAQIEGIPGPGDWIHPPSGAIARDYSDPDQLAQDTDRWYRRVVISGSGDECTDTSNLVHLVVHTGITANAIDSDQKICFDDATTPALRHASLTGGEDTIDPVYTWRFWLEGETAADATDIAGSDFQSYAPAPYTDPGTLIYHYDRVVEIGSCRDTSNAMQVTVMQLPGGQLTDGAMDVCEQDTVLAVNLNLDVLTPGHFELPWEVFLKNGESLGIDAGTVDKDQDSVDVELSTNELDHVSYSYEIDYIRYLAEAGYYCVSDPSLITGNPVPIDVSRRPDPLILTDGSIPGSFKVCNDTAILVIDPDNGLLSYWSNPAASVSFSPATGENEFYVSIPNAHDEYGIYRIYARSEAGDCAGRDSVDLYFFEQPAPASAGGEIVLFLNSSVQLRAEPATAGYGTWELISGSGTILDPNDPTSWIHDLKLGENEFRWTVENGEDEGYCQTSDDVSIVLVNEVKKYNGFSPNGDNYNEYYIMQGLPYADEFSISFINSLGSTVRTIDQDNIAEIEYDESMIEGGLREDEMVVWDGRADNGNLVASGTYYFVLHYIKYPRDYETGEIIAGGKPVDETFTDYVVVIME